VKNDEFGRTRLDFESIVAGRQRRRPSIEQRTRNNNKHLLAANGEQVFAVIFRLLCYVECKELNANEKINKKKKKMN
jgi:hypothetical protein